MLTDKTPKTNILEYKDSEYLLDLKSTNETTYLQITQSIWQDESLQKQNSIKIKPEHVELMMESIIAFLDLNSRLTKSLSVSELDKLKKAYWKSTSLEKLKVLFPGHTISDLEQSLRNEGIEITNQNAISPKKKWYPRKR